MLTDNILEPDSNFFIEAEFQYGCELFIWCRADYNILVSDINEQDVKWLERHNSHEDYVKFLSEHGCRLIPKF